MQQHYSFYAVMLADGSAVVAGVYVGAKTILGTPLPDASNTGTYNTYIARITTEGTPLWVTSIGESARSVLPTAIAVGDDETVYVMTLGYGVGDDDVTLIPIRANGTVETALHLGGGSLGNATELIVGSEGLFIGGEYTGDWSIGGASLPTTREGHWNFYLARIGGNGTAQWTSAFDCGGDEWAPICVRGLARWGTEDIAVSHSYWPEVVDSFDMTTGVLKYSVTLGWAGNHPHGAKIASGLGGSLLVAASFATPAGSHPIDLDGKEFFAYTDSDIYLASLAPGGIPTWERSVHGVGDEWAQAIAQLSSGDIFIAGIFEGESAAFGSGEIAPDPSGDSAFVARFDSEGTSIGAMSFGGRWYGAGASDWPRNGFVSPSGISEANGNPVFWGTYQGEANLGFGAEDDHRDYSAFILRFE